MEMKQFDNFEISLFGTIDLINGCFFITKLNHFQISKLI